MKHGKAVRYSMIVLIILFFYTCLRALFQTMEKVMSDVSDIKDDVDLLMCRYYNDCDDINSPD